MWVESTGRKRVRVREKANIRSHKVDLCELNAALSKHSKSFKSTEMPREKDSLMKRFSQRCLILAA